MFVPELELGMFYMRTDQPPSTMCGCGGRSFLAINRQAWLETLNCEGCLITGPSRVPCRSGSWI